MPQVDVSFDIDANGILQVRAKDKTTNKEQSIRIEARSGLSDVDIERMKREASEHETEDKNKRELIEVKNVAEQLVYTAEKSLREYGEKVSADIKSEVETNIETLKKAKEGVSRDEIRKATDDLSRAISKIGEAMGKQENVKEEDKKENGGDEPKVRDAETG
jgi:molecular chaperone DnaK